jgi:hypothetical protein
MLFFHYSKCPSRFWGGEEGLWIDKKIERFVYNLQKKQGDFYMDVNSRVKKNEAGRLRIAGCYGTYYHFLNLEFLNTFNSSSLSFSLLKLRLTPKSNPFISLLNMICVKMTSPFGL